MAFVWNLTTEFTAGTAGTATADVASVSYDGPPVTVSYDGDSTLTVSIDAEDWETAYGADATATLTPYWSYTVGGEHPVYVLGRASDIEYFGDYASVGGLECRAVGESSHADGINSYSYGKYSHAEGDFAKTGAGDYFPAWYVNNHFNNGEDMGLAAHSLGQETQADGIGSLASGIGTVALGDGEVAIGRYNDVLATGGGENVWNRRLFVVGNGTSSTPSNAFEVYESGNAVAAGDVTDGSGNVLSDKADAADLPTKTSDLANDNGFLTSNDVGDVASDDVVPIAHGGTNATSASAARTNLGLGSLATKSTLTIEHTTIESTSAKNTSAVASGGNVNFTCTCTVPDGYTFAGIQRVGRGGGAGLVLLGFLASDSGDSATLSFRNLGTSPITANTASATCEFRFIKVTAS